MMLPWPLYCSWATLFCGAAYSQVCDTTLFIWPILERKPQSWIITAKYVFQAKTKCPIHRFIIFNRPIFPGSAKLRGWDGWRKWAMESARKSNWHKDIISFSHCCNRHGEVRATCHPNWSPKAQGGQDSMTLHTANQGCVFPWRDSWVLWSYKLSSVGGVFLIVTSN